MKKNLFLLPIFLFVACANKYENTYEQRQFFALQEKQPFDTLIVHHTECTECSDFYLLQGDFNLPSDVKSKVYNPSGRDIKVCGNFPKELIDPNSWRYSPGLFEIIGKVIKADTSNGIGTVPLFYIKEWTMVQ